MGFTLKIVFPVLRDMDVNSIKQNIVIKEVTGYFNQDPIVETNSVNLESENIIKVINKNFDKNNFAITDISHSRAVIQIKGLQAKEVLKKGCPININEIQVNNCAGTVFNGITIVVDCVNNNPDTFNLLALRSFGETFYHHITDAALEFGYFGV